MIDKATLERGVLVIPVDALFSDEADLVATGQGKSIDWDKYTIEEPRRNYFINVYG
jgi:hypothetical protein